MGPKEGEQSISVLLEKRRELIDKKLDPAHFWKLRRRPLVPHPMRDEHYGTVVQRVPVNSSAHITKSFHGYMQALDNHERHAYYQVHHLTVPRVAALRAYETSGESSLNTPNLLRIKDHGPDLADWFTCVGPVRLYVDNIPSIVSLPSPLLDPKNLLAIARAMLEALKEFHAKNFVHCDLKADNFCAGFRTNPGYTGGVVLSGELDLETLSLIDLGCALLPDDRKIYYQNGDKTKPIYVGANSRYEYVWPQLLGANNEDNAKSRAAAIDCAGLLQLNGGINLTERQGLAKEVAPPNYVSDHYLLASELATLGKPRMLKCLDWRIDFYSLGRLIEDILRFITRDNELDGDCKVIRYLESLPNRLKAFDTDPFINAPTLPHDTLISSIDELIGEGQHRRIAYRVVPEANPFPWYEPPPETTFSALAGPAPVRRHEPGQPTVASQADAAASLTTEINSDSQPSSESQPPKSQDEEPSTDWRLLWLLPAGIAMAGVYWWLIQPDPGMPESASISVFESLSKQSKWQVTLEPDRNEYRIGKDPIRLRLQSHRAGYFTLLQAGSGDAADVFRVLYANSPLDTAEYVVPPEIDPLVAQGPPGNSRLVALVTPGEINWQSLASGKSGPYYLIRAAEDGTWRVGFIRHLACPDQRSSTANPPDCGVAPIGFGASQAVSIKEIAP